MRRVGLIPEISDVPEKTIIGGFIKADKVVVGLTSAEKAAATKAKNAAIKAAKLAEPVEVVEVDGKEDEE